MKSCWNNNIHRREAIELLSQIKILFEENNIETMKLPSLDPIELIEGNIDFNLLPDKPNSTLQSIIKNEETEFFYIHSFISSLNGYSKYDKIVKIIKYFSNLDKN